MKVADSGANVAPGQSRTLYTVLTPGNYVFVCNLPGHYRLGMRAALVVQRPAELKVRTRGGTRAEHWRSDGQGHVGT